MFFKIFTIPNPMIGEASLPNFLVLPKLNPERMRVAALNELYSSFECDLFRWCKQEMDVLGH